MKEGKVEGKQKPIKKMPLKFVIKEPKAKLLFTPTEFYDTLKDLLQHSKNRIVLSCLYIGKGKLEKELIKSIINNERRENIRIDILLDKQRGTRPEGKLKESSITVLSELFKYCNNVHINLFHNPLLGAFLYHILPYRVNEAIGVMHMKAFICDNNIILSGANLSEHYLSNRQDRYFLIQNKLLADAVHKIINTIQKMSFTLNPNLSLNWNNDLINPLMEAHVFREQYYRRIQYILKELKNEIEEYYKGKLTDIEYKRFFENDENEVPKTKNTVNEMKQQNGSAVEYKEESSYTEVNDFFYPLFEDSKQTILVIELALQCGFSIPPIYDESDMIEKLLRNAKSNDQSLVIASGYLNFPQIFLNLFQNIFNNITSKNGKLQLITASPAANSFYKSEGLSNLVPNAYSGIAHLCIEFITKNISAICTKEKGDPSKVERATQVPLNNSSHKKTINSLLASASNASSHSLHTTQHTKNIYLEYYKPKWTFHSKGMWLINNINSRQPIHSGHIQTKGETNGGSLTNFETSNDSEQCSNELNTNENINSKELPWSTVIGSSNYGYRATYRDLEMSFVIKTNDYNLKCQLQKELSIMYESSECVQTEELSLRCPTWLKILVKYVIKWFL